MELARLFSIMKNSRSFSNQKLLKFDKLKLRRFIMQPIFSDVLETIETFSFEEKETLVDILQHRLQESKRQRVVNSVNQARRDHQRGDTKVATVDEIMSEILS
jgi:hypothetical protein